MPDKSIPQKSNSAEPLPVDQQTAAQAIVSLHIARRNLLIYPATHEQVQRSLERAFGDLCQVLANGPNVTMAVMKDTLKIGSHTLPLKNPVFKDLSNILKQYQIATVTFGQGLDKEELVRFLQLIITDNEEILARGGIEAQATEAELARIRIQAVDYSHLHLTEESEILPSSHQDEAVSVWQQFVSQMLATSSQESDGLVNFSALNLNPGELAGLLNSHKVDVQQAIDQYEEVITAASGTVQQSQPTLEEMQNFQNMIKELSPNLQKQFLTSTFDQCDQMATMEDAAHLIDGLGGGLIVKMLRQANSEGKKISPSLLAFINKIGHLQIPESKLPLVNDDSAGAGFLSTENIEELLAHEQYDTYVEEDYGELLRNLTLNDQSGAQSSTSGTLEQDLAESLDDVQINSHVGRAMASLMAISNDVDGYRDWARQLAYILDDLLDTRAFPCLIQILDFIRKEQEGADQERAEIAGLVLDRFSDPQFVTRSVASAHESGAKVAPDALAFLRNLGEPVAIEILEGLISVKSLERQGVLMQLLDSLGPLAVQEALERINDSRPDYVRVMVRVVRRLGDDKSAEQVKTLMDHGNPDVRMEALATLLKLNNKWGLIRLRELINEPWSESVQQAFELAGRYKVREVVPNLIAYVQRRGALKVDVERRAAALRALGGIGDSRAIPALTNLAHRRWTMARKHLRHLKEVLFESLAGYPHSEVKALLHFGFKQKNEVIRNACEDMLRSGSKGQPEH